MLDGRHALVTGGGRGIGRAVAAALTRAGARVTILGRDTTALSETVGAGEAQGYVVADVTDEAAVKASFREAAGARGPIDILIANAGIAESAPLAKARPDQFRRLFEFNVVGVVHCMQAVLADMTGRGFGRIVVNASVAGLKGYAYVSAYCASKHAVIGLVRAAAQETIKSGVTVNAVCPGYTDTELVQKQLASMMAKTGRSREELLAEMLREEPLGRLITPEEVAEAVLFLCSPRASAVTGTTLTIAGGEV
ncbi:MAG: SDR family oxidoreductase [Xanthobacteraceae bacterium]|nr:SDR family oxidoreductase [Xanthobacteraceae bacterium]